MDEKTTGIVSYLWWVGLIIAIVTRKEKTEYTNFHIRQSLGLMILSLASFVVNYLPMGRYISSAIGILIFILWIIALIGAINGEKKLVPVLGEKFQEWFKNI